VTLTLATTEIRNAIAEIIENIDPPEGLKVYFYKEASGPIEVPAIVIVWRGFEVLDRGPSNRRVRVLFDLQLLFSVSGEKYNERAALLWADAILNAFDRHLTLSQTALGKIESGSAEPVEQYGGTYMAVTFPLTALVVEAFDYTG
jgi:hypothetical protein